MSSRNQSSSGGMSTAVKAVLAGLAAGAVVGGAYLFLLSKDNKEEDDAFTQPIPAAAKEQPAPVSTSGDKDRSASSTQVHTPTSQSQTFSRDLTTEYSFAHTSKNDLALEEPHRSDRPAPHQAVSRDGAKHYERLGILMQLPMGWQCKEEQPPVPTMNIISITKPEFEHMAPTGPGDMGRVPVILLSCEDVSLEGLSGEEYLAKSKMLAFQQMMMMSQGQMAPKFDNEGPLTIGPFNLSLEYSANAPSFQMKVMNLIHVENGLAYVLQIMSSPSTFAEYRSQFIEIAKGIELCPHPLPTTFADHAFLQVRTGTHKVEVPPSWKINATTTCIASFSTPSQQKTDTLSIYSIDDDVVLTLLSQGSEISESKLGDVTITTYAESGSARKKKLFTNGSFAMIAHPVRTNTVTVSDDFCAEVLRSLTPCTEAKAIHYVSPTRNMTFELISNKGVILETRVGDGALVYAPDGMDQNSEEPPVTMTIRVEDPSTDPDCMGSLDEWYARIKAESQGGDLHDLKRETIGEHSAVTFVAKEMVEVGPGMKEERSAKVIIFVHQGRTHMLRWEATSAGLRRSERQLNSLLSSYKFLN